MTSDSIKCLHVVFNSRYWVSKPIYDVGNGSRGIACFNVEQEVFFACCKYKPILVGRVKWNTVKL